MKELDPIQKLESEYLEVLTEIKTDPQYGELAELIRERPIIKKDYCGYCFTTNIAFKVMTVIPFQSDFHIINSTIRATFYKLLKETTKRVSKSLPISDPCEMNFIARNNFGIWGKQVYDVNVCYSELVPEGKILMNPKDYFELIGGGL